MTRSITRLITAALLTCCFPGALYAQDDTSGGTGGGLVSTTTTGGTTLLGVLTTVGIVWLVMPKDRAAASVHRYMTQNKAALEEALVMGHGDAMGDLAAMSGVGDGLQAEFAEALAGELAARDLDLVGMERYELSHAVALIECMQAAVDSSQALSEESSRHISL